MTGCPRCGALSGLDPEGRCNACGESTLASAKPGKLMNNAGVRAAAAELKLSEATALLRECSEQMGFDDTELGERVLAWLEKS